MKAIVTSYRGATNTRGSRIYARAEGGNSASVPYPHEFSGAEAHFQAAKALAKKLNWTGELIAGGLPNQDYVFVFSKGERFSLGEKKNPVSSRIREKLVRGPGRYVVLAEKGRTFEFIADFHRKNESFDFARNYAKTNRVRVKVVDRM